MTMKILSLVGARPQFVKEALIGAAARAAGAWNHVLVHSGQHYDMNMSDVFFRELGIPTPQHHLGIGSGSHGAMTAAALAAMEGVLQQERPNALLVYGDTNTTLAGALAAAKLCIPVIHVEAGIRQQPKSMPEEINRVLTDHVSTLFCCCSRQAAENLAAENIRDGVHVVGDVMYDLFLRMQPHFTPEATCNAHNLEPGRFVVATLHRDFNVDSPTALASMLRGLSRFAADADLPVLLPLHPRTQKRITEFNLSALVQGITCVDPLGYLELMSLVSAAALVVTDSGGLQKEAYYAGRRAVVVMPDTGWRELTDAGWNLLCAPAADKLEAACHAALQPMACPAAVYGDGKAAEHIVSLVAGRFARLT
ncbi:UDP-N-acetylglucosamine 2-epimerase [Desulfovibrio sp. A2]|nr:UDP-N-acetylglucosamine 2-epimerase [Desulfovibrio sp. A2]